MTWGTRKEAGHLDEFSLFPDIPINDDLYRWRPLLLDDETLENRTISQSAENVLL